MSSYYHIMLSLPGILPTDPAVVKKLDLAVDWFRYAPNCWIVYTSSNAQKWYDRLKPLIELHGGNVFIAKLDLTDRQGWISKELWDWLRKPR